MGSNNEDSLQYLPMDKWVDLEKEFLSDWVRGISGYNALITQKKLTDLGLDYGFKVYYPRGDVSSGMVALNKKGNLNEIIILCPKNDTGILEDSLTKTKLIDWKSRILVPYMPDSIQQCVRRVTQNLRLNMDAEDTEPNELLVMNNQRTLYEIHDTSEGIVFKHISDQKDIAIVDFNWRNRYDGSIWFFTMLATAKFGYGLYLEDELVSWVFINEAGALTHLFTLDKHRKKGYGEILMKHVCNICINEKRNVFAYCRKGNIGASKLYEKLGFERFHEVRWCHIRP